MKNPETPDTGWRGSPDVWLQAAHDLLVENGIDAVRILPLAKRLNIARTSFYWHFKDRETLLAALADRWAARTTAGLIAATTAYADTKAEAMLNLISCFLDDTAFDSRLEFAIRSWALQDSAIMARLNAEAGIDITPVAAGPASITVEFLPRRQLQAVVPQAACFVVPRVTSLGMSRDEDALPGRQPPEDVVAQLLRSLLERPPAELTDLPGLGPARACALAAALELWCRRNAVCAAC